MTGPRAGLIYLGLAAGGLYLFVTGNAAKLVGYLTGAVTGTPTAATHPLQGPSFARSGEVSAIAQPRLGRLGI